MRNQTDAAYMNQRVPHSTAKKNFSENLRERQQVKMPTDAVALAPGSPLNFCCLEWQWMCHSPQH